MYRLLFGYIIAYFGYKRLQDSATKKSVNQINKRENKCGGGVMVGFGDDEETESLAKCY